MVQPFNYIAQVQDPLSSAMAGFEQAQQARADRENVELAREQLAANEGRAQQTFANQQTLFNQGQQDRTAGQAAAQEQAARLGAFRADFAALGDNPTREQIISLTRTYPQVSAEASGVFETMEKGARKNTFTAMAGVYAALDANNVPMAVDLLETRLEAQETSGDDAGAASTKAALAQISAGPAQAKNYLDFILESSNPGWAEMRGKLGVERRAAATEPFSYSTLKADLDLTVAETAKVRAETEKMNKETRAVFDGLKGKEAFNAEKDLRTEYNKRIGTFVAATDAFERLEVSALDESGAGDVALIFSFMKMLDPGSVVRESEFALAQDTSGLLTSLENSLQKAKDGKFLAPEQRESFIRLAREYMASARGKESRIRADMQSPIDTYKLNPANVFGNVGEAPADVVELPGQSLIDRYGNGGN